MSIAQNTSAASVRFSAIVARRVAQLAVIALVGVAYFAVVFAAFHVLRPDLDPIRRVGSNYAVGPYGFLMTTAFLALAVGEFALALALYYGMTPASRSRVGMILLGTAGLGVLVGAIFPTDVTPDDSPITWIGAVHILSAVIGFLALLITMFLMSQRFRKDEHWRSFSRPSFALACTTLAAFTAFFIIQTTKTPVGGIAQRVFTALYLLWPFLTAFRLRVIAKESLAT